MHNRSFSRSAFLAGGTLATLATAARLDAAALHPAAAEALRELMAGNARFVADKSACPPLTARRLELEQGQSPFAIVVSCSDSRVPVETIFDQMPGDIFGVRVAGNFVDDHGLGSIEYSVAALKSSLILVLGHTQCGAVKATVQYVKDGTKQPSHIQSLVDALVPAVKETKGSSGNWVHNATVQNAKMNAESLRARSTIVTDAVAARSLSIAAGVYDLHTGRVTVIA